VTASRRILASITILSAMVGYLLVSLGSGSRSAAVDPSANRHPLRPPFLMYRALAPHGSYGRVALLPLHPDSAPVVSALSCSRVHYARGHGLCAAQEGTGNSVAHVVYTFDRTMNRGHRIPLDGIPTRLRVAPNGRLGAITTYAEEETAAGERLTTRTRIVDMSSGAHVADLHGFRVENLNVAPEALIDITGAAFERDGDRFFATLAVESERYLMAGSLNERRLSAVKQGVSIEALSPNGRRLAVKRLLPDRGFWQVAVIDLASWSEVDLAQGPRSVDDQVEWLDDHHVLYHDADGESTALWMLPADGRSGPRVLLKHAYSGAVAR
jgi:hypothetical protein